MSLPNEEEKSNSKGAERLQKKLQPILASFEKCKEWPEFSNWISNVHKVLNKHKTPITTEKEILAKRMAQCLHPQLPHGVHLNALDLYDTIFTLLAQNQKGWAKDLAVFSVGLFPFFHYASFQVKPKILELYKNHYLSLGKELIPCLPGLVVSVLPGLDEQNEEVQKGVLFILDELLSQTGSPKEFIGCLWMALMRVPSVRTASIKYLTRRQKMKLLAMSSPNNQRDNSPISSSKKTQQLPAPTLVLSEEPLEPKEHRSNSESFKQMHYRKAESAIEHAEIKESEIEFPYKSSLVISAILAALDDENIMVKRAMLDYLTLSVPVNKPELFDQEEMSIIVEGALRQLGLRDNSISRRVYSWLFGPPDYENKYNVAPENSQVVDLIINAFKGMFKETPRTEDEASFPLKVLHVFFDEHIFLRERLLDQLAINMVGYIYRCSKTEFSSVAIRFGNRVVGAVTNELNALLMTLANEVRKQINPEKSINKEEVRIIELVEFTFDHILSLTDQKEQTHLPDSKREYVKVLLEGVLGSLVQESEILYEICCSNKKNYKVLFYLESFQLANKFFVALNSMNLGISNRLYHEKAEIEESFRQAIPTYITAFSKITGFFSEMYRGSEISQGTVEPDQRSTMRVVSTKLDQRALKFFSESCSMVVLAQQFLSKGTHLRSLPPWLFNLFECIKSTSELQISMVAIETVVLIFSKESENEIYSQLKSLIYNPHSLQKDERFSIVGPNEPPGRYLKLMIEKLWPVLDYELLQEKVVVLLRRIYESFGELFVSHLSGMNSRALKGEQEKLIQRFAVFWRLTSEAKIKESNKEAPPFCNEPFGLLSLLEYLDDMNPLLRHASKSWLIESTSQFTRVIDPLIHQILKDPEWFLTPGQQRIHLKDYNPNQIAIYFRHLKNITMVTDSKFTAFTLKVSVSKENFAKWDSKVDFFSFFIDGKDKTYFYFLVVLCLRFIEGQALDTMGTEFSEKNMAVTAAAAEFLEIFLLKMSEEHKEKTNDISLNLFHPLVVCLNYALSNEEEVRQFQILSLMRSLMFNNKSNLLAKSSKYRDRVSNILSCDLFMQTLLQGLSSPYQYVVVIYKEFIMQCIVVAAEFIQKKEVLTKVVMRTIGKYREVIKKSKHVEEDFMNPGEKENGEEMVSSKKRKRESLSENKNDLAIHAIKKEQLLKVPICLDGIMKIIQFFLKTRTDQVTGFKNLDQIESSSLFGLLTFGAFSSSEHEEKGKYQFAENNHTCQFLLGSIGEIFEVYDHSWKLSKTFKNACEMSRSGVPPYNYDKFSEYHKTTMKVQEKNHLKRIFMEFIRPVLMKYPEQVFQSLLPLWMEARNFAAHDPSSDDPLSHSYAVSTRGYISINKNLKLVTYTFPCFEFLGAD